MRIPVQAIVTDGLSRVRATYTYEIIEQFATRMKHAQVMADEAQFPPVVVFNDEGRYILADGFYRVFGARMNGWRDIDAFVYFGTEQDALWYAIAANSKEAGSMPLTPADVRFALTRVFKTWPTKQVDALANHIQQPYEVVMNIRDSLRLELGLPNTVTGADGKFYPVDRNNPERHAKKRAEIAAMLRAGKSALEIRAALGVRGELVADVRREIGLNPNPKRTRELKKDIVSRMRELAASGHTILQIVEATGMGETACRKLLRKEQIDVTAEAIVGKRRRIDSNRIVQQLVMDADSLMSDLDMVNFGELDKGKLAEWRKSLLSSRRRLGEFIAQLESQQQMEGQEKV